MFHSSIPLKRLGFFLSFFTLLFILPQKFLFWRNELHPETDRVVRVIQPGVFDYQSEDYLVRMRIWGVSFPKRDQPGYQEALSYTEKKLLSSVPKISLKLEFDENNFKVVEVELVGSKLNISRDAISQGIGWHNEEESGRYGPFLMAQLKARRLKVGIWKNG